MNNSVKVGIFVLVISGLLGFLIIKFSGKEFGQNYKEYFVYFTDAQGLSQGADVQVQGVKSGKVEEIKFEQGKVKVKFKVRQEIPIYKDAKVVIRTYGLMGDKYLYVEPGNPSSGELVSGGVIENTTKIASTEEMIDQVRLSAKKFGELMDNLNKALGDERLKKLIEDFDKFAYNTNEVVVQNKEDVRQAIANIRAITAELRQKLPSITENLDKTLENTKNITDENREDIRKLIANLKDLSVALKEKAPKTLDSVDKAATEIEKAVSENRQDLRLSIENIKKASDNLNQILAKVNEGKGTLGKLVNEDSFYNNVNEGVKSFAEPFKVVKESNLEVIMQGEKHTGNKDSKAGAAFRFVPPSDDRYYYVGILSNSQGYVDKKEEITANGTTTTYVTKKYGILFDLQYARKILNLGESQLWARFGIKDSSADLGGDFVLSPNLKFVADVYRFNRKDLVNQPNNPQFDFGLEYRFSKYPVFVKLGGSDLLNSSVRGFYIGGGFVFTDNYLKYLLGSLPKVR
ncbi:mce related protein [Sulfurihydrogenibium azorense Az-Fu1]|uniref:Mce related protein n=1 Tax=Sulfurihydrogenibium azorense (strain DSM 15241 / OCM 825 / Az-Fu1) TaxID=204536 RepID=C1DTQ3_SULAA|nr:MlaD family protein [Sulfurihydrogenibium azorense]ACN99781.1 mce related protein [Sulfurihydrogenibium azorense Az-Fu1]